MVGRAEHGVRPLGRPHPHAEQLELTGAARSGEQAHARQLEVVGELHRHRGKHLAELERLLHQRGDGADEAHLVSVALQLRTLRPQAATDQEHRRHRGDRPDDGDQHEDDRRSGGTDPARVTRHDGEDPAVHIDALVGQPPGQPDAVLRDLVSVPHGGHRAVREMRLRHGLEIERRDDPAREEVPAGRRRSGGPAGLQGVHRSNHEGARGAALDDRRTQGGRSGVTGAIEEGGQRWIGTVQSGKGRPRSARRGHPVDRLVAEGPGAGDGTEHPRAHGDRGAAERNELGGGGDGIERPLDVDRHTRGDGGDHGGVGAGPPLEREQAAAVGAGQAEGQHRSWPTARPGRASARPFAADRRTCSRRPTAPLMTPVDSPTLDSLALEASVWSAVGAREESR